MFGQQLVMDRQRAASLDPVPCHVGGVMLVGLLPKQQQTLQKQTS
jgi:hypothetical protein